MHKNSYEKMVQVIAENLSPDQELKILDIGSLNINGCYKPIFESNPKWLYTGADAQPGPNVDVVLDWDYQWQMLGSESFDVVISGQTLEHMEAPWLAVKAMERVCKVGGLCVILVPARCDYHPYPIDCWRIFPDGMRYLMTKLCSFETIDCGMFEYELDGVKVVDTIFVGRKRIRS